MFQHLFDSMNHTLDNIIQHYPTAAVSQKKKLNEQLSVLKSMSDHVIEQWLSFEEKMAQFYENAPNSPSHSASQTAEPALKSEMYEYDSIGKFEQGACDESFIKGQGYYKLFMFRQAIELFEQVVRTQPDFIVARLYLAMSYLKIGDGNEAYRHFKFIIPMTDNARLKAISYNALGCIQMLNRHPEMAEHYFQLAHKTDPTLSDPLINLEVCAYNQGTLQYGSGLTH